MATARRTRGHTLIELMLALALAAVIAGIGSSAHRVHLLRARRTEAIEALLAAAAEQERFHLVHGHYAKLLGSAVDHEPPGIPVPAETPHSRYRLQVEHADGADFRIVARPLPGRGQQDDSECAEIWIEGNGLRGARSAAAEDRGARCW